MLRFGIISEIDGDKGLVKVKFPESDIVSGWLPMVQRSTKSNRYFSVPDVQDHVACLMDENAEHGVVIGSVYSKDETPDTGVKGKDVAGVKFSDGTKILYDRSSKTLTIEGPDVVHVVCDQANVEAASSARIESADIQLVGDVSVTGSLTVSDDIETSGGNVKAPSGNVIAGPLNIGLTTHKHTGVTPGTGTSATPVP